MSVANLQTALDAVEAELAAFDQTRTSYGVDGRSIDHDRHYESLVKRQLDLQKAIIRKSGAAEIHTTIHA